MFDSALAILLYFSSPHWQMRQPILLTQQSDFEESEKLFSKINPKTVNKDTYHFYRMVNNFRMNNRVGTVKHYNALQDSFDPQLPERYKVVAGMVNESIKMWEKEDIADIARDMQYAKDRLNNGHFQETTVKLQNEILAKLDKLIKEKEDKANNANQSPQDGSESLPLPSGGSNPSNGKDPATDSHIAGSGGTGKVDPAKMRKLVESWGRLPPREQARALQELTAGLPARHREAIDNYFRNLAKTKR